MTDNWHRVASLDEVEPDEPVGVKVGKERIALFNVDGTVYALADMCSHAFARLSHGFVEGCEVLCPAHQARFDLATGAATAGPADEPVRTYPVEIRDGEVFVQV